MPLKTINGNISSQDHNDNYNYLLTAPSQNILRQGLLNPNMDVCQRGTSFSAGARIYTLDRWYFLRGAYAAGGTVSQQSAGLNGSDYCIRVKRNQGDTDTNGLYIGQIIESMNARKYRGKKLTLSFYARKGADFSGANSYMTARIGTNTAADASSFSANAVSNGAIVLTTSWQLFSITTPAVIDSSIQTVGVDFNYTPTGTAGANDYFEITQVQLCAGDTALPFEPRNFEEELRICKRYYYPLGGQASYHDFRISQYNSNVLFFEFEISTYMRIPPSFVNVGVEVTDWQVYSISGASQTGFALSIDSGSSGNSHICIKATKTAHGMTDAVLSLKSGKTALDAEL